MYPSPFIYFHLLSYPLNCTHLHSSTWISIFLCSSAFICVNHKFLFICIHLQSFSAWKQKKINSQIINFLATTTNPSSPHQPLPGHPQYPPSGHIAPPHNLLDPPPPHQCPLPPARLFQKALMLWQKISWFRNIAFFCYVARQSRPSSTDQKHFLYMLQLAVHTVHWN